MKDVKKRKKEKICKFCFKRNIGQLPRGIYTCGYIECERSFNNKKKEK